MALRTVKCADCGGEHFVGRRTAKQGKTMHRFHLRRLTPNEKKAPSWEPMAACTNATAIARQMAKDFYRELDDGEPKDAMVWDYHTGREVCRLGGVNWAEQK